MSRFLINDAREESAFTRCTFSGYNKSQVIKQLFDAMVSKNIESATYWTAELICSGQFKDMWNTFFLFFARHVSHDHCLIATFIRQNIGVFREEMYLVVDSPLITLRNSARVRERMAQLVFILCCAKRKLSTTEIKLTSNDFNMVFIRTKFLAPHIGFAEMDERDPKELFPFLNEFSFQLSKLDLMFSIYWLEWITGFAAICTQNRTPIKCAPRNCVSTPAFQTHVIWVVWENVLLHAKNYPQIFESVQSIYYMFCLKFTLGDVKQRKGLLYFAISLICEPPTIENDCISRYNINMQKIADASEIIYHQIKDKAAVPKPTVNTGVPSADNSFDFMVENIPRTPHT
jgi:hypothetical protein